MFMKPMVITDAWAFRVKQYFTEKPYNQTAFCSLLNLQNNFFLIKTIQM